MPDTAPLFPPPIEPRSPLAGQGPVDRSRGLSVIERTGLTLLHVEVARGAAPPDDLAVPLPRVPNTTTRPAGEEGPAAVWLGPRTWLLMLPAAPGQPAAPPRPAASTATVVDLSHGRCVLRLVGPAVRTVLADACPADLSRAALGPGTCAQTLWHDSPVLVVCVAVSEPAGDTVDLVVPRSYAASLWDSLRIEARTAGSATGPGVLPRRDDDRGASGS